MGFTTMIIFWINEIKSNNKSLFAVKYVISIVLAVMAFLASKSLIVKLSNINLKNTVRLDYFLVGPVLAVAAIIGCFIATALTIMENKKSDSFIVALRKLYDWITSKDE
jgi:hypothetical protein